MKFLKIKAIIVAVGIIALQTGCDQGEIKMSKNFDSEVKRLTNIKAFSLADVKLEDEYFLDVTQKDIDFLNTFDVERLLYNFRLTAGLPKKA